MSVIKWLVVVGVLYFLAVFIVSLVASYEKKEIDVHNLGIELKNKSNYYTGEIDGVTYFYTPVENVRVNG